jgi:hypothetical protein
MQHYDRGPPLCRSDVLFARRYRVEHTTMLWSVLQVVFSTEYY